MKNKYIVGVVSLFVFVLSFISIIPAQQAFAQTTPTCPVGYTCTTPVPVTNPTYIFSVNLTVGSTGADVVALQAWLIANGFLSMPNGPTGYFGSETKAAVATYQASVGLPADGFFGPLTIAKINGGTSSVATTTCPVGYVCSGGGSSGGGGTVITPPTISTDATVTVGTNPTLTLSYGNQQKESLMSALFIVTVNGGTKGINVNSNGIGVVFSDKAGNNYYNLNSVQIKTAPIGRVDTVTDTFGQKLYVVPAQKNIKIAVTATVNPQQLFEGTYKATLANGILVEEGTNGASQFTLPITKNQTTNTKVIIGEIAPRISSITSSVAPGNTLTITGQRLDGVKHDAGFFGSVNSGKSGVFIDKTFFGSKVNFSKDGTSATLTIPSSFPAGEHSLYVVNSATGNSNSVGFMVSGDVVTPSSATVKIIGTPTIALTYDSAQKESGLTATFNVTVTAGKSNLFLSTSQAAATFLDQTNQYNAGGGVQVNVAAGEKGDYYGRNYTVLSPGTSVQMTIILTVNPSSMFAGSYYGSLMKLYSYNGNPSDPQTGFNSIPVPANQTPAKTIVGELSPYITSVTSPVSSGQSVTISGQRLSGTILIDGLVIGNPTVGNGTSLTFTLPSSISAGQHYVSVNNAGTGLSNQVAFTVVSTVSALSITIDPSSPINGIIQTSSGATLNVPLAVFDIKSTVNGILQSVTFNLNTSGTTTGAVFNTIQLKSGSLVLGTGTLATPSSGVSTITFSGLNVAIPANVYMPLTLSTGINGGVTGVSAYASFTVSNSNIIAVDTSANKLTISGSGTISGNPQTFTMGTIGTLSNLSFAIASPQSTAAGLMNVTTFNGSFTVTAGAAPVFIAKNPLAFTTAISSTNITSNINGVIASNGAQSYDGANYYMVTPGSSRTFTVNGTLTNTSSSAMPAGLGITTIYLYSDSGLTQASAVTGGLQGLNSDLHIQVLLGAQPAVTASVWDAFSDLFASLFQ